MIFFGKFAILLSALLVLGTYVMCWAYAAVKTGEFAGPRAEALVGTLAVVVSVAILAAILS